MIRLVTLIVCTFWTFCLCSQTATVNKNQYSYGFESPLIKPPWVAEGGINAASIIDDPTDVGMNKVLEVKLPLPTPVGAVWTNTTTRSEIRWQTGASGIPNWFPNQSSYSYHFRVYVPSDHVCDPRDPELWAQWHQPNGFAITSPPLSIRTQNCHIVLLNHTSEPFDGKQSSVVTNLIQSGLQWTKGRWHYIIIDINWDFATDGNGMVRVYLNTIGWPVAEDLIINYRGPTGYNNGIGANFKLGVYKWRWRFTADVEEARNQTPQVFERHLYYDDVTIKKGHEFGLQ